MKILIPIINLPLDASKHRTHKAHRSRIRMQKHKHTQSHAWTDTPAVVNLLLVSPPFPLLSCTAPDKQHQKQHSHQPQRKHPFTCSGIYLLTPLHLCVCVCVQPPFVCMSLKSAVFLQPRSPILSPVSVFLLLRLSLSVCLSDVVDLGAAVMWWPQRLVRSCTSRCCQEAFPHGSWGCYATCTHVGIVLLCHFCLSV